MNVNSLSLFQPVTYRWGSNCQIARWWKHEVMAYSQELIRSREHVCSASCSEDGTPSKYDICAISSMPLVWLKIVHNLEPSRYGAECVGKSEKKATAESLSSARYAMKRNESKWTSDRVSSIWRRISMDGFCAILKSWHSWYSWNRCGVDF